MIDEATFQRHLQNFPALASLESKLIEMARDEMTPDEHLTHASKVSVGGVPGCAWISNRRVMVLWTMKMLIFFKFPAMQEFHLAQIRRIDPNGATLFLRSEADGASEDDGWEENTLMFESEQACQQFVSQLQSTME